MSVSESTYEYRDLLSPVLADPRHDIVIEMSKNTEALWRQFVGIHEVVIYKDSRKLFPAIKFSACGLKPDTTYAAKICFDVLYPNLFTFNKRTEKWISTKEPTKSPPTMSATIYETGDWFQNGGIDFSALNITSSQKTADDKIEKGKVVVCLTSRTMYQVRIVLYEMQTGNLIYLKERKFDEMVFITCTEYRGKDNRELKKSLNRYARKRSNRTGFNVPCAKRRAIDQNKLEQEVIHEQNIEISRSEPSSTPSNEIYQYSSLKTFPSTHDSYYSSTPEEFQPIFNPPQMFQLSPNFQFSFSYQPDYFSQSFDNVYYDSYFNTYNQ